MNAGQELPLATYYEIQTQGCRALPPPRVTVIDRPALGRITVVRVERQAVQVGGRCATMTAPVVQVRYRALRPGTDALAWEVRYQTRGAPAQRVDATVQVTPGGSD